MGKKKANMTAELPEWLQEGRTVWYWRETYCTGELCTDKLGSGCPMNQTFRPDRDTVAKCARRHPVLDSLTVWAVLAMFEPGGIRWVINDAIEIRDEALRSAVFPDRKSALKRPPEVVVYG